MGTGKNDLFSRSTHREKVVQAALCSLHHLLSSLAYADPKVGMDFAMWIANSFFQPSESVYGAFGSS